MKLPTLLGLALLTTAIVFGIAIFLYRQKLYEESRLILAPQKIQIVNISDSSATITWQTEIPAVGLISYGSNQNLSESAGDDRDKNSREIRLTHFVTINNLQPNKNYYYKIKTADSLSPNYPLSFKTAALVQKETASAPIRGSVVVDESLTPVDEALIFLKIPGAADLASFTTTAGNFIIPLKNLYQSSLTDFFAPKPGIEATLVIARANLESSASIILPLYNQPLPPILLGESKDLRQALTASPTQSATLSAKLIKFDLNNDGQLNSLDVSIIIDNFGKKQKIEKADLNGDWVVDQKDLDILKKALESL